MAHSLSAKKRVRQNTTRNVINRARKSMIKTQIKRFEDAIADGQVDSAKEQFRLLSIKLDKVASTSTLHKKTAARMKSRLARSYQQVSKTQEALDTFRKLAQLDFNYKDVAKRVDELRNLKE